MPTFSGKQAVDRGNELREAREKAYSFLAENPYLTAQLLRQQLEVLGYKGIDPQTLRAWVSKFPRLKRGPWAKRNPQKVAPIAKPEATKTAWEQIMEAIPDRMDLASLILDGITKRLWERGEAIGRLEKELSEANDKIKDLSQKLQAITEDRCRIMAEYNARLLKEKYKGHYSLDQIKELAGKQ